ncbi:hypothetical protein GPECTOR_53g123 [Gonium pectorale]|uniref:Uncharacterized protein n=1 Tax=Gonium pectorale TaxID=33097 RepID=A0A150G6R5_GONPE|nr:hypothetical protein GPECTOR_53g123 [Gonium pectorale]|eukprot:KXZ45537.1 hypothetical protein GPECTOR_53g123 [Gonium pectorale]
MAPLALAAPVLIHLGIPGSPAGDLRGRPCLFYLLSYHLVQLCAAQDGGPTYGLPQAGEGPGAAPRRSAEMDGNIAQFGLEMWENTIRKAVEEPAMGLDGPATSLPPLNRRAAFWVAMRLAAAALKALPRAAGADAAAGGADEAAGEAGAVAADGSHPGKLWAAHEALLLRRLQGTGETSVKAGGSMAMLLWRAFKCAPEACREEAARTADAAPPGALGQLEHLWELRLAAAECAQQYEVDTSAAELPASPSLDVAAALGAGYVSRIERMMRLCSPEVVMSLTLPGGYDRAAWAQVLAFGPLRDTQSLLATAAKKVRKGAAEPVAEY